MLHVSHVHSETEVTLVEPSSLEEQETTSVCRPGTRSRSSSLHLVEGTNWILNPSTHVFDCGTPGGNPQRQDDSMQTAQAMLLHTNQSQSNLV